MAVCKRPPVHLGPPRALQRLIKERTIRNSELRTGLYGGNPQERRRLAAVFKGPIWTSRHFTAACWNSRSDVSDRFVDQSVPRLETQFWARRGVPASLDDRRWERLECLGTSSQEDDRPISQSLIKQAKVTICGPQPAQRPSCSDKVRQVVHQSGELDPNSPTIPGPVAAGMLLEVLGGATKMAVSSLWRTHAGRWGECTRLRGRAVSLGERVEMEADGDTTCLSSRGPPRQPRSLLMWWESSKPWKTADVTYCIPHVTPAQEKTKPMSRIKGQKYHHPRAFQDVGKAGKFQRGEFRSRSNVTITNSYYCKCTKSVEDRLHGCFLLFICSQVCVQVSVSCFTSSPSAGFLT